APAGGSAPAPIASPTAAPAATPAPAQARDDPAPAAGDYAMVSYDGALPGPVVEGGAALVVLCALTLGMYRRKRRDSAALAWAADLTGGQGMGQTGNREKQDQDREGRPWRCR
ncbi:MAG: hypothetical protein ACYC1D_18675, partial [Acidimicrobiales bacterium]